MEKACVNKFIQVEIFIETSHIVSISSFVIMYKTLAGKEKLVEVLLQEEHLNTFLVSHGFSHPLLEKINVIKRNNISQIEV